MSGELTSIVSTVDTALDWTLTIVSWWFPAAVVVALGAGAFFRWLDRPAPDVRFEPADGEDCDPVLVDRVWADDRLLTAIARDEIGAGGETVEPYIEVLLRLRNEAHP